MMDIFVKRNRYVTVFTPSLQHQAAKHVAEQAQMIILGYTAATYGDDNFIE